MRTTNKVTLEVLPANSGLMSAPHQMTRGARGGRGMRRGGSRPPSPRVPHPAPPSTWPCVTSPSRGYVLRQTTPKFTQALLKRHTELTPSPAEQAAVLHLVTKIETVVENLAVVPGDFAAFQLLMVRHVGAFKQGTMLKGDNSADLVFILKTLPTKEAVEGLSAKVTEELKTLLAKDETKPGEPVLTVQTAINILEGGFTVTYGDASVRVLVSTVNQNLRKLKPDVHLPYEVLRAHSSAIGHTMWFEENAQHSSIKVLVRLLKDLCRRHSGLSPLKPWLLDTLAHYAIMNYPTRTPLPLNVAFRRVLQLLSSGFYLPGAMGAGGGGRGLRGGPAHSALGPEELDRATMTAQTLLRVLARGGHAYVLGLQEFEDGKDISCEITVWDGVVVSPLATAYEPSDLKAEQDDLYAPMDEGDSDSPNPVSSNV